MSMKVVNKIIFLAIPVSGRSEKHRSPWSNNGEGRRSEPIADRKHGIKNGQASVAISGECRIILMDTVQHDFLQWARRKRR